MVVVQFEIKQLGCHKLLHRRGILRLLSNHIVCMARFTDCLMDIDRVGNNGHHRRAVYYRSNNLA